MIADAETPEAYNLLFDRALHTIERERTRIAADLHDGLLQQLAAFGYTLDLLELQLESGEVLEATKLLKTLRSDLTREIGTLRRTMTDLRPPALDDRGIEVALREYGAEFEERTGIRCAVSGRLEETRLDADSETILYRAMQQALANVARHSMAGEVRIDLADSSDEVSLAISDDGVGFVLANDGCPAEGHYGLLTLRERIANAEGELRIETSPGHGTRIEMTLPRRPQPVVAARSPHASNVESAAEERAPRLLIIDDEPLVRDLLSRLLAERGFDIVGQASNGLQAVELSARLSPDLVLMDVHMKPMDGHDAARIIRARQPRIQVVLLTGDDHESASANSGESAVFAVAEKGSPADGICETLFDAWQLVQEGIRAS